MKATENRLRQCLYVTALYHTVKILRGKSHVKFSHHKEEEKALGTFEGDGYDSYLIVALFHG